MSLPCHCDYLIIVSHAITQNEERQLLENAAIAVDKGRIAAIGEASRLREEWLADVTLDMGRSLALPALINAHAHAAMTFLRGLADDLPLMKWLQGTVFPAEARLTREVTLLGALLGHAEMLASGCGACVDMYIFEDAVFEAAEMSGIRCLGGEAVFGFPSAACGCADEALEITAGLHRKYAGHERIRVAVNPHSVYTTSTDILDKCRSLALELSLPLHIHLAETREETIRCMNEHGQRPVERCLELGLFDVQAIAAHLVDINDSEAAALARAGVLGVHNPSSNMKLASGVAPVVRAAAAGLRQALGTDGPASNNQLNMFAEMRACALMGKLAASEPTALPATEVLDMATLHGAAAFGIPGLGSLAPGAPADLAVLDISRPNMLPMHNPVSQTVYAASGHECRLTMIGGEILFQDGRYKRFDYDALVKETALLSDFVMRKGAFG